VGFLQRQTRWSAGSATTKSATAIKSNLLPFSDDRDVVTFSGGAFVEGKYG
jgi:hypothetical protein